MKPEQFIQKYGVRRAKNHLIGMKLEVKNNLVPDQIKDELNQTINDLERAIKDHESVYQLKCSHGYDVACLICGFGTVNGERVYHNKGKSK
ncbi:hypothetical protein [Acinetobacter baumannii]|uniref:hypothetical protein n=1 Tax=Acinetobacter baumannii TaxID=470 RepID=UPI0004534E9A|nr:hypothetical protein [Acinetobacter baumannii]EXD15067.1 hypothetical protein J479_2645 [Acinetobacter baumannii 1297]